MKKFQATVQWSGYSRGCTVYEIKAEDLKEAKKIHGSKCKAIKHIIVRDDTEKNDINIKKIEK